MFVRAKITSKNADALGSGKFLAMLAGEHLKSMTLS